MIQLTLTDQLRLLAGKIANIHWMLDQKSDSGCSDFELGPLRDKVNELLTKYARGCEYFDCSHKAFEDNDEEDDPWFDFYYCRSD